MDVVCAVVVGIACGLLGSIPTAQFLGGGRRMGMRRGAAVGLVAVGGSFVLLTGALAVAYKVSPGLFPVFSASLIGAYLVLWAVEAIRTGRSIGARRR